MVSLQAVSDFITQYHPILAVATCDQNKNSNVVPVGNYLIEGNQLLIADIYLDKTKSNLLSNPSCAISMRHQMKGFQIKGTANYLDDTASVQKYCLKLGIDVTLVKGRCIISPDEIYQHPPKVANS